MANTVASKEPRRDAEEHAHDQCAAALGNRVLQRSLGGMPRSTFWKSASSRSRSARLQRSLGGMPRSTYRQRVFRLSEKKASKEPRRDAEEHEACFLAIDKSFLGFKGASAGCRGAQCPGVNRRLREPRFKGASAGCRGAPARASLRVPRGNVLQRSLGGMPRSTSVLAQRLAQRDAASKEPRRDAEEHVAGEEVEPLAHRASKEPRRDAEEHNTETIELPEVDDASKEPRRDAEEHRNSAKE